MAKGKFDMSEFLTPVEGVPESDTTREIAVNDILDNPLNFYPRPDNEKLAELMESIQANGMLEPPTVVPAENGKYRLISGHSRMNAVRLLASYGRVQDISRLDQDAELQILLAGCIDPDLKSTPLQHKFGGITPAETLKAMLLPGEIADLSREVERLSGYRRATIEKVKNA